MQLLEQKPSTQQRQNYHVVCAVVHSVDLFTRQRYIDIVQNVMKRVLADIEGMHVIEYHVSTSRIEMKVRGIHKPFVKQTIEDFKRVSEYELLKVLTEEDSDERKNWILCLFSLAARSEHTHTQYQVWEGHDMVSLDY